LNETACETNELLTHVILLDGSAVSLRDGTSRLGEGANPSLVLPKSQFSRESFQFSVLRKRDSMRKFEGAYGEGAAFELCPRRVIYARKHQYGAFFLRSDVRGLPGWSRLSL